MGRIRADWDWVKGYPVFIYTSFIDHFKFNVKIVLGVKGNQNTGNTGPRAKAYMEYICEGKQSKNEVVSDAIRRVKKKMEEING